MITLRNLEILGRPGVFEVRIAQQKIAEIHPGGVIASGENEIQFENAIAFPGLINSHDHLEFDVYEQLDGGPYLNYLQWADDFRRRHAARIEVLESLPRVSRIRAGIARNLLSGVTTVAHHGVEAEYTGSVVTILAGTRSIHSPRMEGKRGLLIPDRDPVVVHIGEGIDEESTREIDDFTRWNVWQKRLIGVHAIAMTEKQASRFAAVIWCPVSNEFLYGRTAPISRLKRYTSILFGTDSTLTGPWNIWSHLRRARELKQLSDSELIAALTTTAAREWGISDHGRLDEGTAADIVVARKKCTDPVEAFFSVNPEDILLVIKGGRPVLADTSMRSQVKAESLPFSVTVNGREKFTAEDCSAQLPINEIAPHGRCRC